MPGQMREAASCEWDFLIKGGPESFHCQTISVALRVGAVQPRLSVVAKWGAEGPT